MTATIGYGSKFEVKGADGIWRDVPLSKVRAGFAPGEIIVDELEISPAAAVAYQAAFDALELDLLLGDGSGRPLALLDSPSTFNGRGWMDEKAAASWMLQIRMEERFRKARRDLLASGSAVVLGVALP
jgi:hypothetical protein